MRVQEFLRVLLCFIILFCLLLQFSSVFQITVTLRWHSNSNNNPSSSATPSYSPNIVMNTKRSVVTPATTTSALTLDETTTPDSNHMVESSNNTISSSSSSSSSFITTITPQMGSASPATLISKLPQWKGRCWYEIRNFCVVKGVLMAYSPSVPKGRIDKDSLRMCNEFSKSSALIALSYYITHPPDVLPGPLLHDVTGWVLQFWCQDLFHMTLTLMPALQTRKTLRHQLADIYVRIAKGKRHKGGYCRIKFGNNSTWDDPHNEKWGGDKQFPFAGNPYWKFYSAIAAGPDRLRALYQGATDYTACYSYGIIDKMYVKDVKRNQAHEYANAQLRVFGLKQHNYGVVDPTRFDGSRKLRVTLIDRRGRTRRLTNVQELAEAGRGLGFEVQVVAFETLSVRDQIHIVTQTDVLMGMHGNGIMWLQFLPPKSVVIEMIGVWYTPYAKLWGHAHFHSSMKNNMVFKRQGEFVPFAHNVTEARDLLKEAKKFLSDPNSDNTFNGDTNPQLDYLYSGCSPHC
eukprot:PhF_6_TR43099/c0_g1_i1/m.65837